MIGIKRIFPDSTRLGSSRTNRATLLLSAAKCATCGALRTSCHSAVFAMMYFDPSG